MKSLKSIIEDTAEANQAYSTFSNNHQYIPDNIAEQLSRKDERIRNFNTHIDNLKQKVEIAFMFIKKALKNLLNKTEMELKAEFDAEGESYKACYDRYENLVKRCYEHNIQSSLNPSKDSLIQQVNSRLNVDDLETFLKERINFSLLGQDLNAKIVEITQKFARFERYFENAKPLCYFNDGSATDDGVKEIISKITKAVEPVLSQIPRVVNKPSKFPEIFIESLSITDPLQKRLLENWFLESQPQSSGLNLLYRASKDGFDAASFHRLCDNHGPTITVVKSESGRVFGGYTDSKWTQAGQYANSQKAWLFSLDRKEKYPIKQANAGNATYVHPSYGPTFGAHDVYISTNSNKTVSSTSNFGQSYEIGTVPQNERQTALAGSQSFKTVEVEVYEVLL